jgi:hypothetical protein
MLFILLSTSLFIIQIAAGIATTNLGFLKCQINKAYAYYKVGANLNLEDWSSKMASRIYFMEAFSLMPSRRNNPEFYELSEIKNYLSGYKNLLAFILIAWISCFLLLILMIVHLE